MSKVSIIITTHDGRKAMCERAIESVLNQTYQDIELVVMDDASKDGTDEMVKKFKGVKYIRRKTNFGNHSRPKNEGILASTGEYIGFLDSDNVYRPDHVQVLVNTLEKDKNSDIALAYGDRMIYENGKATGVGVRSDFDPALILQRPYIDTSDFLVRRDALFYVGGWDESHKRMLDWNLTVRLAKAGYRFHHVSKVITDYTIHENMLSHQKEEDMFDPYNCKIRLPYLGEQKKLKVAVFTLTYEREFYTKKCFKSMYDTAGYEFDHFVVDNGSKDETPEYLQTLNLRGLILNKENKGISVASNQALDLIDITDKYDIIMKIDNDCLFITKDWLKRMVEIYECNHMMALSCYVQGLVDNPGGAPRLGYGEIDGELIGVTNHLGGICHFVSSRGYLNFRWDETQPLHGVQDLEFSNHLLNRGFQMGYLENFFCEHFEGTDGQKKRFPQYFDRRKLEKQVSYERSYEEIQNRESAVSRGTPWGDRVLDTVNRYRKFFNGRVLDIGCGDGLAITQLQEFGFECQGIDVSERKVLAAQENGVLASVGYMENLPYADKSFDTILCSHTLEHSKDLLKATKEIQRVGKRAVIVVPIEDTTDNPAHTSPIDSKGVLKKLFKGKILHEEELSRLENEYVLIIDLE